MKQANAIKIDLLSKCLRNFKHIPRILDNLNRELTSKQSITKLIECSNEFFKLALQCNQKQEDQKDSLLLHRFFCRIREVIYASLTYYIHTNGFSLIKQLLIQINKLIVEHQPGTCYYHVCNSISRLILNFVQKLQHSQYIHEAILQHNSVGMKQSMQAHNKNSHEMKLQRQNSLIKTQIKNEQNAKKQTYRNFSYKTVSKQQNSKEQKRTNKIETRFPLIEQHAIYQKAIMDLQVCYLQQIKANRSQKILNDCLARNRNINLLVKQYEQQHKNYIRKMSKDKKSHNLQLRPFTSANLHKQSNRPKKLGRVSSQSKQSNIRKKQVPHQRQQNQIRYLKTDENQAKQQFISQICAYRKNYKVHKITIGVNNTKPLPQTLDFTLDSSKFYLNKRQKNKKRQGEVRGAKTFSSRSYINRIIVPLK